MHSRAVPDSGGVESPAEKKLSTGSSPEWHGGLRTTDSSSWDPHDITALTSSEHGIESLDRLGRWWPVAAQWLPTRCRCRRAQQQEWLRPYHFSRPVLGPWAGWLIWQIRKADGC